MEASTASEGGGHGSRARGGARLLRLQSDERLVEMLREGNEAAFEAIVARYRSRLFGFCRKMLGSPQDAEDVLQEVFANAYRAMLADRREINLRPWLFRIARNRCLNHLQRIRAVPEEQERLERIPAAEAATTHQRVQNREEFLRMLDDVGELPDAQRQALLLREFDGLSYADVGREMGTSVPAVRSLLTRARASLLEGSEARALTCPEIKLQLGEAARSGTRAPGPARRHLRDCASCSEFGAAVGAESRSLAAYSPLGLLALFKSFLASKLGAAGGAGASGAAAAGGAGAAGGGGVAAGLGIGGWATGSKVAAATVAVAVVAAGAGGIAVSTNGGTADRIAPAVSQGDGVTAGRSSTVPDAAQGSTATGVGSPAGTPAAPAGEQSSPQDALLTTPGDPNQLPGGYIVPPSTYPDGGAPGTTQDTAPQPPASSQPACDSQDPSASGCATR